MHNDNKKPEDHWKKKLEESVSKNETNQLSDFTDLAEWFMLIPINTGEKKNIHTKKSSIQCQIQKDPRRPWGQAKPTFPVHSLSKELAFF